MHRNRRHSGVAGAWGVLPLNITMLCSLQCSCLLLWWPSQPTCGRRHRAIAPSQEQWSLPAGHRSSVPACASCIHLCCHTKHGADNPMHWSPGDYGQGSALASHVSPAALPPPHPSEQTLQSAWHGLCELVPHPWEGGCWPSLSHQKNSHISWMKLPDFTVSHQLQMWHPDLPSETKMPRTIRPSPQRLLLMPASPAHTSMTQSFVELRYHPSRKIWGPMPSCSHRSRRWALAKCCRLSQGVNLWCLSQACDLSPMSFMTWPPVVLDSPPPWLTCETVPTGFCATWKELAFSSLTSLQQNCPRFSTSHKRCGTHAVKHHSGVFLVVVLMWDLGCSFTVHIACALVDVTSQKYERCQNCWHAPEQML